VGQTKWIVAIAAIALVMASPCHGDEWAMTYGSPGNHGDDRAQCVQLTADGGYVVVGWAAFGCDIWVLKLDADGTIAWQKAYIGVGTEKAYAIQQTLDGGYVVAGDTYSFGDGFHADVWILKLNADGNVAWQRTYGASGENETAHAIQQTADGGYIVACESNTGFPHNWWILKIDDTGTVIWQRTYSATTWDAPYAVQQTIDGGILWQVRATTISGY
jgi:hypothetical protein